MIISHARCGSTFLHSYIRKANANQYGGIELKMSSEFFNRKWTSFFPIKAEFNSVSEKRIFLEKERALGREYSVKVLAYQVQHFRKWFDEFYKDWDKIILLRKDIWRAFLSYEIQSYLEWNVRTTHNRQEEMVANLNRFKIDISRVNKWFFEYQLLETHKGVRLYLEDLSHEMLADLFDVKFTEKYTKYTLDYEPYIINLNEIKTEFHRQESNFYRNRFQHHQHRLKE